MPERDLNPLQMVGICVFGVLAIGVLKVCGVFKNQLFKNRFKKEVSLDTKLYSNVLRTKASVGDPFVQKEN